MHKLLIISGPTATGKTSLGLDLAKKYNGEIISADSRQVYTGMDIVTGKDLPPDSNSQVSNITWRNHFLKYYLVDGIRLWLYDIVNPDEEFNLSFWNECAGMVINDIHSRGKLPIIVGGTGLYIKSITSNLTDIQVPPNSTLRRRFSTCAVAHLEKYLQKIDPVRAAGLNDSDRKNPRRLIRAIEIALHHSPSIRLREGDKGGELFTNKNSINNINDEKLRGGLGGHYDQSLSLCLSAPRDYLNSQIDRRVESRLNQGAETEIKNLYSKYPNNLSSFSASGYRAYLQSNFVARWKILEHQYARRQLTWFKKQPDINWFDVSSPDWKKSVFALVNNWYNKTNAKES